MAAGVRLIGYGVVARVEIRKMWAEEKLKRNEGGFENDKM